MNLGSFSKKKRKESKGKKKFKSGSGEMGSLLSEARACTHRRTLELRYPD